MVQPHLVIPCWASMIFESRSPDARAILCEPTIVLQSDKLVFFGKFICYPLTHWLFFSDLVICTVLVSGALGSCSSMFLYYPDKAMEVCDECSYFGLPHPREAKELHGLHIKCLLTFSPLLDVISWNIQSPWKPPDVNSTKIQKVIPTGTKHNERLMSCWALQWSGWTTPSRNACQHLQHLRHLQIRK